MAPSLVLLSQEKYWGTDGVVWSAPLVILFFSFIFLSFLSAVLPKLILIRNIAAWKLMCIRNCRHAIIRIQQAAVI